MNRRELLKGMLGAVVLKVTGRVIEENDELEDTPVLDQQDDSWTLWRSPLAPTMYSPDPNRPGVFLGLDPLIDRRGASEEVDIDYAEYDYEDGSHYV